MLRGHRAGRTGPGCGSRCSSPRTASTATRSGPARRSSRPSSAWPRSWDPALVERVARATAVEVAATGIHWTFSPVLCIARDLRWGRVSETFGEDPFLIGELGAAMVRGYQGDGLDDPTAILATAKHFAGYSETQGGRDASEADISAGASCAPGSCRRSSGSAREGCRTFMLGYQSMDGVPITANGWLLDDVLKRRVGLHRHAGHRLGQRRPDGLGAAGLRRLRRGRGRRGPGRQRHGHDHPGLLRGRPGGGRQRACSTRPTSTQAVRRVLTLKFELGLFEHPRRPTPARQAAVIGCAEHADAQPRDRPALAGAAAQRRHAADGRRERRDGRRGRPQRRRPARPARRLGRRSGQADWMPDGHPRELTETVLDGLRAVVPADWTVTHARGADILTARPRPGGRVLPRRPAPPARRRTPRRPTRR